MSQILGGADSDNAETETHGPDLVLQCGVLEGERHETRAVAWAGPAELISIHVSQETGAEPAAAPRPSCNGECPEDGDAEPPSPSSPSLGAVCRWPVGRGEKAAAVTADVLLRARCAAEIPELLATSDGGGVVSGSYGGELAVWRQPPGESVLAASRLCSSFGSGHVGEFPERCFVALAAGAAGGRVVSAGRADQCIRVHVVSGGAEAGGEAGEGEAEAEYTCVCAVSYAATVRGLPWHAAWVGEWEAQQRAAGADPSARPHQPKLSALDMRGGSMVVSGDADGCICVWDCGGKECGGQQGGGAALRLVATLPPPDAAKPAAVGAACPHAVLGLSILESHGGEWAGTAVSAAPC